MGHAIDKPTCGQLRHPGADYGDGLTREEKLEVTVPQGSPGVRN